MCVQHFGFPIDNAGQRDAFQLDAPSFSTLTITEKSPRPGGDVWRGMPLDLVTSAIDAMGSNCYSRTTPPVGVENTSSKGVSRQSGAYAACEDASQNPKCVLK